MVEEEDVAAEEEVCRGAMRLSHLLFFFMFYFILFFDFFPLFFFFLSPFVFFLRYSFIQSI